MAEITDRNIKNLYCSLFLQLHATSTYADCSKDVFKTFMNNPELVDELEKYIFDEGKKEERTREIKMRSREHQLSSYVIDKNESNILFYIEYYKLMQAKVPQELENLCNYCKLTSISKIYSILYSYEEAYFFEGITSEEEIMKFLAKFNNPTLRLLSFFADLEARIHIDEIKKNFRGTMLDTDPKIFENISSHIKKALDKENAKPFLRFPKKS